MERFEKILVLGSGGPDSIIAALWHASQGSVVYGRIQLPSPALYAEDAAFRDLGDYLEDRFIEPVMLGRIEAEFEADDHNIAGRNLLLATHAVACGYRNIVLSIQQDEMEAPDRRPEFLAEAGLLLSDLADAEVTLSTPFSNMDKTDMVRWALGENANNSELLEISWSCYSPVAGLGGGWHCGDCNACVRRYIAFQPFGVKTLWAQDPRTSKTAEKYRAAARSKAYSPKRCGRINAVLGAYA